MERGETTVIIEGYLSALRSGRDDASNDAIVRELLARAAGRLEILCARMLHGGFPRLARPPLNLAAEEMLGTVVERLLKALREARPEDVRQFFALANQHLRWELMDLARRLDAQPRIVALPDAVPSSAATSGAGLTTGARRILDEIDALPEEEREVLSLVRFQDLSHEEAADVLGVSTKTVQRRLARSLTILASRLGDLDAAQAAPREG